MYRNSYATHACCWLHYAPGGWQGSNDTSFDVLSRFLLYRETSTGIATVSLSRKLHRYYCRMVLILSHKLWTM